MQPGHLRRVLLTGTLWTTVATYGSGGINFVTTAVLTRLLMPAAFGVGAIVGATAAFFDLLAEMAVGTSVVQRRDLTQRELSSIWWLAIAAGIGIAIAFAAGGRAAGRLLASADVGTALPAVGITAIVYAVASVPQAMLRRELRFRTVAATQATGSIAGAIAAIAFALFGFGYWVFVAQAIVNVTARAVFAIAASRWRPDGAVEGRVVGKVGGYAAAMAANATINHWSRNLDTVIIGHFLGIVPLGLYNLAQRLVAAPAQFASAGMRPLLHPAFARISNDLPRMRRGYLELVRITALLTFSLSAVLVTVAEPLVLAIAGPRWLGSVPLLRILAVLSALQPVNVLASSLFLTQNAPAVLLKSNIVTAAGLIGGMLAGLRWGTPGVAAGYVIVYVLLVVPCGSLLAYTRLLHGRAIEWLARLALPSAAAAAVLVAGFAADALQPHTSRDVVRLAVIGVADAVALLPFIYLAWRRAQMTS